MKKALLMGMAFLTLLVSIAAAGDVPQLVNYQGRLTDASGNPLNGNHNLVFRIYNANSGGTLLWGPQTFSSVACSNGHFNVILSTDGSNRSVAIAFTNASAFMEITLDGAIISPRQQILSAPYAVSAQNAKQAENAISATNATNATQAVNANHAVNADVATRLNGTLTTQYTRTINTTSLSVPVLPRTYNSIAIPGSNISITVSGYTMIYVSFGFTGGSKIVPPATYYEKISLEDSHVYNGTTTTGRIKLFSVLDTENFINAPSQYLICLSPGTHNLTCLAFYDNGNQNNMTGTIQGTLVIK